MTIIKNGRFFKSSSLLENSSLHETFQHTFFLQPWNRRPKKSCPQQLQQTRANSACSGRKKTGIPHPMTFKLRLQGNTHLSHWKSCCLKTWNTMDNFSFLIRCCASGANINKRIHGRTSTCLSKIESSATTLLWHWRRTRWYYSRVSRSHSRVHSILAIWEDFKNRNYLATRRESINILIVHKKIL